MHRALALFFFAAIAITPFQDCEASNDSIAAFVAASGGEFDLNFADYDILLAAVSKANLVGALANPEANFTLFAPNDYAFIRLARDLGYTGFSEAGAWAFLDQNVPTSLLTQVLLYHVVGEELSATDVLFAGFFGTPVQSLLGATFQPTIFFTLSDNDPDAADAGLFTPITVQTGNAKVHTITRVMRPIDL